MRAIVQSARGGASLTIMALLLVVVLWPLRAEAQIRADNGYNHTFITCREMATCRDVEQGSQLPGKFTVCPAASNAPDVMAERILYLLGAGGACQLYSPGAYQQFVSQVPAEQRNAANYIQLAIGEPLLSSDQARLMEASAFAEASRLPGAPPVPGDVPPSIERSSNAGAIAQVAPDSGDGACGFPLSRANAASQDGMAGVEGGCEWLEKNTR